MRTPALFLTVLVVLSGCLQGEDGTDGNATADAPVDLPGLKVNATENTTALRNGTAYVIDQAALAYEHAVKRWVVTAEEDNVTFDARWTGRIPGVTYRPACLAGSIHGPGGDASLAAWPLKSRMDLHARTAGQSQTVFSYPASEEDQDISTEPWIPFDVVVRDRLDAGDRMVIELGGSNSDYFSWNSTGVDGGGPRSMVAMNLTGAHAFEPLPDAALACGRGAEGADGSTAGVTFYGVEAEAGGTVAFTSAEATTMWLVPGNDPSNSNTYSYSFLGSSGDVTESVELSAAEPGTASVTFDQNIGAFDHGISWLFVDSDWGF